MKTCVLVVAALLAPSGPALAQDVVRNPARPPAADAGRVVSPQCEWSIKDTGDGYFMTNPTGLKLGPDGSVYVLDINKILRFDADGRFVRAYRPASASEQSMLMGLDIAGDAIVAFERFTQRVHIFELDTGAERTFDVPGSLPPRNQFLFHRNGRLYFSDRAKIFSYTLEGKREGPEMPLPTDQVERAGTVGAATVRVAAAGTGDLMLCSSFDYLIRRFDLAHGTITRVFGREYTRVENENPSSRSVTPYKLDVQGLLTVGERLWVFTSTIDKAKGVLVDVFDLEGRFLDNFHLQVKDGDAITTVSPSVAAASGRSLIVKHRRGTQVLISKFTLPAGIDRDDGASPERGVADHGRDQSGHGSHRRQPASLARSFDGCDENQSTSGQRHPD